MGMERRRGGRGNLGLEPSLARAPIGTGEDRGVRVSFLPQVHPQ